MALSIHDDSSVVASADVEAGRSSSLPSAQVVLPLNPSPVKSRPASASASACVPVSLTISDVCFSTLSPTSGRTILHSVSGQFHSGTVTAILGNSGSGKSSLFSILFGRLRSSSARSVTGRYFLNGREASISQVRQMVALVPQHSPLFAELSLREALRYLAELKLPAAISKADKLAKVEQIIRVLDLQGCADQQIGAESEEVGQRGLSGGQRRRAALAGELLSDCPILLLDEVSSGLDAFHSYTLMQMLRRVARSLNRTILLTVHQPAHELAQFFDSVLLLHHGRTVYHAGQSDLMPYFQRLNFQCPPFYNPFDFLFLRVLTTQLNKTGLEKENSQTEQQERAISILDSDAGDNKVKDGKLLNESKESGNELSAVEQARLDYLTEQWKASELAMEIKMKIAEYQAGAASGTGQISDAESASLSAAPASLTAVEAGQSSNPASVVGQVNPQRLSFWRELPLLFHRHWLIKSRSSSLILVELLSQALMILLGCIPFIQFSLSQSSILNRLGGTSYIVEITGMLAMFGVLDHFSRIRPIVRHEYWNRSYSLIAYFVAHSAIEQAARAGITVAVSILVYFIVGYQLAFVKFLVFVFSLFLISTSCGYFGIALSALFETVDLAIQFGEIFTSLFFLLQGYYINYNQIKPFIKQIGYLIPNQYLFQAMSKNEFYGLNFDCPQVSQQLIQGQNQTQQLQCAINEGAAVVREMHFLGDFAIGESFAIVIGLNFGLLAMGYWALKKKLD